MTVSLAWIIFLGYSVATWSSNLNFGHSRPSLLAKLYQNCFFVISFCVQKLNLHFQAVCWPATLLVLFSAVAGLEAAPTSASSRPASKPESPSMRSPESPSVRSSGPFTGELAELKPFISQSSGGLFYPRFVTLKKLFNFNPLSSNPVSW